MKQNNKLYCEKPSYKERFRSYNKDGMLFKFYKWFNRKSKGGNE